MQSGVEPFRARRATRDTSAAGEADLTRDVGPVLLARLRSTAGAVRTLGGEPGRSVSHVAAYFLPAGEVRGQAEPAMACAAGDVLLLEGAETRWLATAAAGVCLAVFVPRARVAAIPSPQGGARLVPGSAALVAAARQVGMLLDGGLADLGDRQAELAARALQELLLAALAPSAGQAAPRREAGLLERAVAAIGAAPSAELDATRLSSMLGCSRSALYRATAPAGGVAELIVQRRLLAIAERLRDARDTRPIATIAREHGLPDAALFGRRFKRQFEVTPGAYRERAALDAPGSSCS